MRIIVLSKNRAAQCELLLRSIKEQMPDWHNLFISVLYNADSNEFFQGYSLLKKIHPEFHYQREDNTISVNRQIASLLDIEPRRYFSFFVDDLVVIRPFSTADPQFRMLSENRRGDTLALSLRLNPRVTYSQPTGRHTPPPKIDHDGTYRYRHHIKDFLFSLMEKTGFNMCPSGAGVWKYQMILDGNVYRFDEFKAYFSRLPEIPSAPRIEETMLRQPMAGKRIIIYPESHIINIASNRIRTDEFFPCGDDNPSTLNDRFLSGEMLDYDHLQEIANTSCHLALRHQFRERNTHVAQ